MSYKNLYTQMSLFFSRRGTITHMDKTNSVKRRKSRRGCFLYSFIAPLGFHSFSLPFVVYTATGIRHPTSRRHPRADVTHRSPGDSSWICPIKSSKLLYPYSSYQRMTCTRTGFVAGTKSWHPRQDPVAICGPKQKMIGCSNWLDRDTKNTFFGFDSLPFPGVVAIQE